jgi:hypothetical protein
LERALRDLTSASIPNSRPETRLWTLVVSYPWYISTQRLILPVGVTATCVWTLIEIQVGIIAACAPTIRPIIHELVHNGLFGSLSSAAGSVRSRKSSRSQIEGSSNSSDREHPQYETRRNGGADEEDTIQLHDMAGAKSLSTEHADRLEINKHGAVHVSK